MRSCLGSMFLAHIKIDCLSVYVNVCCCCHVYVSFRRLIKTWVAHNSSQSLIVQNWHIHRQIHERVYTQFYIKRPDIIYFRLKALVWPVQRRRHICMHGIYGNTKTGVFDRFSYRSPYRTRTIYTLCGDSSNCQLNSHPLQAFTHQLLKQQQKGI